MRKNFLYALLVAVGILLGYIFFIWLHQPDVYHEIKTIELGQLVTAYIIAIFIVYAVNTRINKDVKRRELFIKEIDNFQGKISDIYGLFVTYISNPNSKNRQDILLMFRRASNILNWLIEMEKNNQCKDILKMDGDITRCFYELKASMTDEPFTKKRSRDNQQIISFVVEKYEILTRKILNCKLNIYTE